MKMSKRDIENAAREADKLAKGKPAVSKYERKNLTEEQYQELVARQRGLSKRGGMV